MSSPTAVLLRSSKIDCLYFISFYNKFLHFKMISMMKVKCITVTNLEDESFEPLELFRFCVLDLVNHSKGVGGSVHVRSTIESSRGTTKIFPNMIFLFLNFVSLLIRVDEKLFQSNKFCLFLKIFAIPAF